MRRLLFAAVAFVWAVPAYAQDKAITPEQLEFFEAKVRPVLVQHCYECHSAKAKKLKATLLLDSRAGMLEGGDNGPAIVPGDPEKSRLIEAIRHTNVKLKMPKKSKLPDAVIADLTNWVKMGAPWPDDKLVKKGAPSDFDLQKRKKDHWCWQPIRVGDVPKVKDIAWPQGDIDCFLLAKLETKGLKPAGDADPRTLLRRLHFDIVGLPPSRAEVETFVKAWDAAGAKRGEVLAKVVDQLLDSPQFGERWARHWLDLVRYAESRGHEFDYTLPNAFQYRDYVIRAINADVPYYQFVHEHVAGDLLSKPRLHKDGFNESIIGTAFWFLGEEVHSPVDIRQDQADRFDNRIDVMTKTFLGLTVACARCHDHKFDAISTKDYYALFGFLESSNYRLARFDTITHNRKIAEQLAELREKSRKPLLAASVRAAAPTYEKLEGYLLTAMGVEDRSKELNPVLLKRWQQALVHAGKDETSPLHAFAKAAAEPKRPILEVLEPILKRWPKGGVLDLSASDVIADYRNIQAKEWLVDDAAFGLQPVQPGDIVLSASPKRPLAHMHTLAAAQFDSALTSTGLRAGTQNESGRLGGAVRAGRTLRTPEFVLKDGKVSMLVRGAGMAYAAVGQHIMHEGPLHGALIHKFNTSGKLQWVSFSLAAYKGQRLHLELTPTDSTDFAVVAVVQCGDTPAYISANWNRNMAEGLSKSKTIADGVGRFGAEFRAVMIPLESDAIRDDKHEKLAWLGDWFLQNLDLFVAPDSDKEKELVKESSPIIDQQKKLLAQIKHESRLVPAIQDGSGTDSCVFTRGNPKTLGPLVTRRFLEAFAGSDPLKIKAGSGRLELAQQMTDPVLTPLITRVFVNRVWHHLFGRGIVGSVDNFGVLGEAPTHPELLDYLADKFAKDGWSTKKLIRALVLTRAYQMSSAPDAKADEADPGNLLMHRMRLRRLEGEAIRDAILRVSGRLDAKMYGPSVPVHLTPFQDGRGKPATGPLDGDGRRSVYLAARRNFLSTFLLAFDTPAPFSTVGKRTVSNVPAQALILMNDPFVHQQAELWAKRVVAEKASDAERVRGMYLDAFARPPTQAELQACEAYLGATPDVRRWADL